MFPESHLKTLPRLNFKASADRPERCGIDEVFDTIDNHEAPDLLYVNVMAMVRQNANGNPQKRLL